jgi:hypothetical protein
MEIDALEIDALDGGNDEPENPLLTLLKKNISCLTKSTIATPCNKKIVK